MRHHLSGRRLFNRADVPVYCRGAFLRPGALQQALRWGLPLFITAVGVAVSFRAGYFNIGAQGQFYMGAIAAAFMAEWLNGAPAPVLITACFLAGMTGGALWALWPGLLRLKSGADEVITTLMGNFIAGLFLLYVTAGPLKDPSGTGQQASSRPLAGVYRISDSLGLSPTIIAIAVIVGLAMWFLINRTAFGVLSGLAGATRQWCNGRVPEHGASGLPASF
ncbi:ABC transporter permease [Brucella pituitosa]|uniref:ABC transporter permease n=1 Tax=Brucella pituitosa TaxID=571256 RepID=UPI00338FF650